MHDTRIRAIKMNYKRYPGPKVPKRFADTKAMHAKSIEMVTEQWGPAPLDGETWPAYVIAYSEKRNLALTTTLFWGDTDEKEATFVGLSAILKQHDCDRYSFISETRIFTMNEKTGEKVLTHEDAMTVCTADRAGRATVSSFYKDDSGFHHEKDRDLKPDDAEVGGATTRLLVPGNLYDGWEGQLLGTVQLDPDEDEGLDPEA